MAQLNMVHRIGIGVRIYFLAEFDNVFLTTVSVTANKKIDTLPKSKLPRVKFYKTK